MDVLHELIKLSDQITQVKKRAARVATEINRLDYEDPKKEMRLARGGLNQAITHIEHLIAAYQEPQGGE